MKSSIRLFVALFVGIAPIVFAADDPADIEIEQCLGTGYNWGGEPNPGNSSDTLLGIPGDVCQGFIFPENQIVNICHHVIVPVCYCPAGYSCAEGDDYPACKRCPPGHYCPYDGDYDPIECDEGYFCPEGSKAPRKCRSMDVCPAKSHSFVYLGGLVVDFILLVSLYGIIRIWKNSKNASDASSIFVRNSISPGENEMEEIDKPKFMTFDLKFVDLGCTLEIKKGFIRKQITKIPILAGVTGELPHGKVTAVMGPSGAGKTTFLNVLCGKVPRTSGVVYVNGREDDIERYTKVIGFVPQEDVMLRSFTVEEILTHSARIRLPRGTPEMEIKKKVDEVIQLLGLGECRHSIIGDEHQRGISGGQRKRVNIAMELVMSPSMLFLDEPTSGLDSSSAEECVRALQTIARLGINVIAVIHQPRVEIFRMFDTLLLLGKGGRTVYVGPPMDAVEYFQGLGYEVEENVNAPDWYMDITSGLVKNVTKGNPDPSHLFEEWDRTHPFVKPEPSMERKFTIANSKAYLAKKMRGDISRRTPSFFEQVYIYICRGVIQSRHGFSRFCLDCFLFAFTGIYLGLAFVKPKMRLPITYEMRELCPAPIRQIPAYLAILDGEGGGVRDFCSICTPLEDRVGLMFFYMAMGVGLISAAVSAASGVKTPAYFIGLCIVDAIKIFVYTNFYMSTFYLLAAPLSDHDQFFWLIYLLIFAVFGVGYISSVWLSKQNAGFVAVIVGSVWSLTSGVVFSAKQMGFIGWLSFPMWFGEGAYKLETTTIEYENIDIYADVAMGYDLHRLTTDYVMIGFLGFLLRFIAFIGLRYTNRDKQR